jgi:hypothetical protein
MKIEKNATQFKVRIKNIGRVVAATGNSNLLIPRAVFRHGISDVTRQIENGEEREKGKQIALVFTENNANPCNKIMNFNLILSDKISP